MAPEIPPAAETTHGQRFGRPLAVYLYLLGAAILGVTALFGGGSMLLDPTGASMELPLEWLAGTPFSDYLVPGAVLFGVLGVGAFVVAAALLFRHRWAWWGAVALGVVLVGWIVTQLVVLGMFHVFHLLYGALGVLLAGLPFTASFRRDVPEP